MKSRRLHIGITDALRMLPDFCWMNLNEVLAYVEQINETAEYPHMAASLNQLVKRGEVEVKTAQADHHRTHGRRGTIKMWKAVQGKRRDNLFAAWIALQTADAQNSPDIMRFYPSERRP